MRVILKFLLFPEARLSLSHGHTRDFQYPKYKGLGERVRISNCPCLAWPRSPTKLAGPRIPGPHDVRKDRAFLSDTTPGNCSKDRAFLSHHAGRNNVPKIEPFCPSSFIGSGVRGRLFVYKEFQVGS